MWGPRSGGILIGAWVGSKGSGEVDSSYLVGTRRRLQRLCRNSLQSDLAI